MQKRRYWLFVLVPCLLLFSTIVLAKQGLRGIQGSGGQLVVPLGDIVLNAPEGVAQTLASVRFPHSDHFVFSCTRCHHDWVGDELKNCTASGCHDRLDSPERPVEQGVYTREAMAYYKYAYHNQCRGCHMEQEAGPVKCFDCHPRR